MGEETLEPITNISTDGDPKRQEYTTIHLRDVECTWKDGLVDLSLMDKMVGPRGLTHKFDLKHIEKRKRTRDKSKREPNRERRCAECGSSHPSVQQNLCQDLSTYVS